MSAGSNLRYGLFQRNILEILNEQSEGMFWKDLFDELDRRVPPTEFENGQYKSNGQRRRPYIVRFSSISLVKAGWLHKDRGTWLITDEGKKALALYKTPEELERQAGILYRQWSKNRPVDQEQTIDDSDVEIVASTEEAEDNAISIITQYMSTMDPYDFQNLIGALLEGMNYYVSWIAPPGKDGGMDIIAFQDPLGATGRRIKVQVKRKAEKVGAEALRSFLGVLSDDDIGLYICTGGFSSDAQRAARESETKRITLLDAKRIYELWAEYYHKLPQEHRELMPIKPIYHLDLPQ